MAKEVENTEQNEHEEKSVPKKTKGDVKLPVIIGIIFGTLILLILAVRFLFLPFIIEGLNPEDKQKEEKKKTEQVEKDEKNVQILETGRITTNPKNSTQFVIVNLANLWFPKTEEALIELEEEAKAAGAKEGEGGTNPAFSKTMVLIKGSINKVLGSMTVEELQFNRDSLPKMFKTELSPIFKKKNLILKDVIIQEFIIQ